MDRRFFSGRCAFSFGFAFSSSDLLRRLLREHLTDDARDQLAQRVVEHLDRSAERSGR
jgi:hypothetical protein